MVYITPEFNEPQVPELDEAERELDAAIISGKYNYPTYSEA
jgi:hypothetical protein